MIRNLRTDKLISVRYAEIVVRRTMLVGGDEISVEEFLSRSVREWLV